MSGWFPGVAAQAAAVAVALFSLGWLIARAVFARSQFSRLTVLALAFPSVAALALALALAHIATGGAVLSNPWVVRAAAILAAVAAAVAIVLQGRVGPGAPLDRSAAMAVGWVLVAGLVLWGAAVTRMIPLGAPAGDIGWHMGWTSQLLAGETTPSALITGQIPNYYPWLYHALVATVAAFAPGGTAYHALPPLHLLQVAGAVLGLAAVGHRLGRSWAAAAGTATFGALAFGFAFALVPAVDRVVPTPVTGGPRGTYVAAVNNLAPALPRDLGYTLLIGVVLLLCVGIAERSPRARLAAGVVLGLCGLASAEFFFVGLGVAALTAVMAGPRRRIRTAAAVVGPAIGIFAIWAVPLMASYVRLGGFVNTTAVAPIALPPIQILMAWGPATLLGAYGLVHLRSLREHPPSKVMLAFLLAAPALLAASSLVPAVFGEGFEVLGRAPRYWPVFHLAVAILAGMGAGALVVGAVRVHRLLAVLVAGVIVGLSVPLSISLAAREAGRSPNAPVLADTLSGGSSLFSLVGSTGTTPCVVAAPHSIGFRLWSYTGYRLVAYRGRDVHVGNFSRIRWREIYRTIPSDSVRLADLERLLDPGTPPGPWREIADRYGVDIVVVPTVATAGNAFGPGLGLERIGTDERFTVLSRRSC